MVVLLLVVFRYIHEQLHVIILLYCYNVKYSMVHFQKLERVIIVYCCV